MCSSKRERHGGTAQLQIQLMIRFMRIGWIGFFAQNNHFPFRSWSHLTKQLYHTFRADKEMTHKMRRRKDLSLYQPDPGGGKGYVYRGSYWEPPLKGGEIICFKALMTSLAFTQLLLVFAIGRLNLPSMRTLFVVLPFLALLFFSGRMALASSFMFGWKDRMTQHQHESTWLRLKQSGMLAALTGCAFIIGQIAHLLFGAGDIRIEWPMFVLQATAILVSGLVWRTMAGLPCRVVTPQNE